MKNIISFIEYLSKFGCYPTSFRLALNSNKFKLTSFSFKLPYFVLINSIILMIEETQQTTYLANSLEQLVQHPPLLYVQKVLHFERAISKVLYFSALTVQLFAIIAQISEDQEGVVFLNDNSDVLRQFYSKKSNFTNLQVLSPTKIIWIDSDRNEIYQWDFSEHAPLRILFKFFDFRALLLCQLFYFGETGLICIAELGDNLKKLTYLKSPLKINSEAVQVIEQERKASFQEFLHKGNNKSLLVWHRYSDKRIIAFKTYELKIQEQFKIITKSYCMPYQYEHDLKITNIWRFTNDNIAIVTAIDDVSANYETIHPTFLVVYDKQLNDLRNSKIAFEPNFYYEISQYFSLGRFSIFFTYNSFIDQAPFYFINNSNEKIAAKGYYKHKRLIRHPSLNYDSETLVEAEYENSHVQKIYVRFSTPFQFKVAQANILLELIPQIDEDLLENILQCMQEE